MRNSDGNKRAVIFDLDGTLADTSGDLIAAANTIFVAKGHGELLDPQADMATAFAGMRAMLRLGYSRLDVMWDESTIDAEFVPAVQSYGENIDVFTKVYDGVVSALNALADRGYRLGVCTNKPEYLAEILLKNLGLRDHFSAMLGADSIAYRKPDARHLLETIKRVGSAPEQSVLIGDTVTDRDAARNANVACALVTFGPTGRDVADLGPEALLDHYDDLTEVVAGLIG